MSDQPTIAADNLKDKLKALICNSYIPCYTLADATVKMTTIEVFTLLQLSLPSEVYTPDLLSVWMEDWGFKLHETKPLRFEWLLKRI